MALELGESAAGTLRRPGSHNFRLQSSSRACAWSLYGGPVPTTSDSSLLPERAPGPRRAAADAYELAYRRYQPSEASDPSADVIQGRRYFPDRAPGPRCNRQAYEIRGFLIDGFAEAEELLQE